jgi:hypothetical protein
VRGSQNRDAHLGSLVQQDRKLPIRLPLECSMLLSMVYFAVCDLLRRLTWGGARDDAAREIEILALRHQLRVLARGRFMPLRRRDRVLPTAFSPKRCSRAGKEVTRAPESRTRAPVHIEMVPPRTRRRRHQVGAECESGDPQAGRGLKVATPRGSRRWARSSVARLPALAPSPPGGRVPATPPGVLGCSSTGVHGPPHGYMQLGAVDGCRA